MTHRWFCLGTKSKMPVLCSESDCTYVDAFSELKRRRRPIILTKSQQQQVLGSCMNNLLPNLHDVAQDKCRCLTFTDWRRHFNCSYFHRRLNILSWKRLVFHKCHRVDYIYFFIKRLRVFLELFWHKKFTINHQDKRTCLGSHKWQLI